MAAAAKKPEPEQAPTSNQFHGELANADVKNHKDAVTTAPVHNGVPQAVGFKVPVEDK